MNLNSKLNEALEEFFSLFSEVQLIHPHLTTPSINTASKFLYARKLNSKRAFDLYIAHQNVRSKENLLNIDPWNIEVKRELLTRKLTILSESDAEGSGVVLFTCRLHQPQISNHNSLLKAFVFQLDAALENLETQKKGLVFIYDMTNSKYNNFDLDLSIKILKLLKGSYPARLKKVLIISAPLWFKAPFKILNPFLLEKLKNRVYTILPSDLPIHLPIKTIPYHMGGQLKHSHIAWVKKCLSIYLSSSLSSSFSSPASKRFHPSNPHPSHNDEKKEEKERKIKEKIEAYFPAEDFQTSTSEHLQYYYEGVPSISNSSTFYTHNINVTSANNNHISNNHNNNKDINRKFQINEDYADFINFQPSDLSNFHSISCNNTNQNNNNNNQNDKKNHNNNLNNVNSSDDISSTETSNKDDRKHKIGSGEESVHQSDKEPHKESSTDDSVKKPRNCGKIASSEESKDDEKLGSYNFDDLKAPSDLLEYSGKAGRHVSELEYYKLRNLPVEGTFNTSKLKGNQDKNRYHDVMCLDQTRVKINQSDPDPPTSNLTTTNDQPNLPTNNNSDYINANYIDGFKSKRQYISTQGPMKNTIGDFWKMVWQEKVLVIVMTTRTTERERTKCEKYWPDDESTVLQHNNIAIIHCDQEQHLHSITTTTLLLQHLNTCETREVKHIHFTGWPDYGVPDDADDFLYLLRYVRQVKRAQWRKFKKENNHLYKVLLDTPSIDATLSSEVVFNGLHAEVDGEQDDKLDLSPVLVHCSAGIGRTGTFLAVDILIDVLNERGKINVYETIRRIREQRPYSIQMPEQYTFVYHAIIQYARQQGMM